MSTESLNNNGMANSPPQSAAVPARSNNNKESQKQQQQKIVTPNHDDESLQKRMTVDKKIVDELLLVCGVIGTTTDNNDEIVPVTDCLNWLQDLQRALRRDDDLYRPISILLNKFKIVQTKLLPLLLHSRYDTTMILTICKILVILTKPLSDNTIRAAKQIIKTTESVTIENGGKKKTTNEKVHQSVIREQNRIRDNAFEQAEMLMELKRAFCHHPSHIGPKKEKGGVLSIFVSLLADPLSRTGNSRTDTDHLTIELVLHLFRNLLAAQPILKKSEDTIGEQLHNELITLLDRELVLEILLVLAADIEQRENVQYNLLLMELLQHIIRKQDPVQIAKYANLNKNNNSNVISSKNKRTGLLSGQLQREKKAMIAHATSRHSQFGGTLVVQKNDGSKKYVSTTMFQNNKNINQQQQPARRKNKKLEPFIGNGRSTNLGNIENTSPAAKRAAQTLHKFCIRFVETCYGPVMKSLKNEFRRDSVRLEDNDRVVFFQLAWFFSKWWRHAGGSKLLKPNANSSIGHLIFTMDVFTFNLVLNATDTYTVNKKYNQLAQSVAYLSEMMHLLHMLYKSNESTEQIMAMGLMDRLYYGTEPIDRLPKLLQRWEPGTSTREYLSDISEICYMTLKLLDINAKACSNEHQKKSKNMTKDEKLHLDTVAKLQLSASDFEVSSYFARKIVSNHTVYMFTQLLTQYVINTPVINQRIIAFFERLRKHKICLGEENEINDIDLPKNPLSAKPVTFEPMLYNIHMLDVLNNILNDNGIKGNKEYISLLQFASTIVMNFANAAKENPVLFVEALFKHPLPHRYCELVTNMYVTEDMRMMAARDILLQQQRIMDEKIARHNEENDDDDDDSDEELEFTDVPITKSMARKKEASSKELADSDDDDENEANSKSKKSVPKASESKKHDLADTDDENEADKTSTKAISKVSTKEDDSLADTDDENEAGKTSTKAIPKAGTKEDDSLADSDDDDDDEDIHLSQKLEKQAEELKKRLRELSDTDEDSSDEDEDNDKPPENKKTKITSGFLSDSDDDN